MIKRISMLILTVGVVLGTGVIAMMLWGDMNLKWTSTPSASTKWDTEIKIGAGGDGKKEMLGAAAIIALVLGFAVFGRSKADGAGLDPNTQEWSFRAFVYNLRKSAKDGKLGGVCGGLGEHSPIPSWVWRVFFLILAFSFGTGVLAYVFLWICMPSAPESGEDGSDEGEGPKL